MASDFEQEPLHNKVHDNIGEDEQLAQFCDAAMNADTASDLRERYHGENAEFIEDTREAWGKLSYVARQRAMEVVAETCATLIREGDQWVEDGHWTAQEIEDAQDEAYIWLQSHTNQASRAGVLEAVTQFEIEDTSEVSDQAKRIAYQELTRSIDRTGGDDHDTDEACTPLAAVREQVAEHDYLDNHARGFVLSVIDSVGEKRNVDVSGADPLTDAIFQVRDEFKTALEVSNDE